MIKKISCVLLACIACFSLLCACSNDDEEGGFYPYNISKYVELGDYMSVKVKLQTAEVTDKDVDDKINSILKENGLTTQAEKTEAIENGDTALIDYVGTIDGVEFQGGSAKNYSLEIGSKTFINGFESGLVGLKPGEKKNLNLKFPDTYHNSEYAGKDCVFAVTVNKVYKTVYPEITPQLLKKLTTENSLDNYKKSLRISLEEQKKIEVEEENYTTVVDEVLKTCKMKRYPKKEVMQYKSQLTQNYSNIANEQGLSLQTFVANNGYTMEHFEEIMENNAKKLVQKEMTMLAIADKEKIKLSKDELDKGIVDYMSDYNYTSHKAFIEDVGEDRIEGLLTIDKTIEYLIENAGKK